MHTPNPTMHCNVPALQAGAPSACCSTDTEISAHQHLRHCCSPEKTIIKHYNMIYPGPFTGNESKLLTRRKVWQLTDAFLYFFLNYIGLFWILHHDSINKWSQLRPLYNSGPLCNRVWQPWFRTCRTRRIIRLTWLYRLDTLAVFLLVATRTDAHIASDGVDTFLVFFSAYGLRLGTLVHIWKENRYTCVSILMTSPHRESHQQKVTSKHYK